MLVKENSIIPVGNSEEGPEYDYAEKVELRVYALKDGVEATTVVYSMDNEIEVKASALLTDRTITIEVETDKPYTIKLVNAIITAVDHGTFEIVDNNTIITTTNKTINCSL